MQEPGPRTVRFGQFELDLHSHELHKAGLRIKLQEKPFEVLAALLERPGEVITREELQKRLWPGDTFVDFDHSLNAAINRLREALGDTADNPRFIETLARRGYRFIAPVEIFPLFSLSATGPQSPAVARRHESWPAWLLAAVGLAALASLAYLVGKQSVQPRFPTFERLTFRRGTVQSARFAPDGRTVLYSAAWDGQPAQIYLAPLKSPQSLQLGLGDAHLLAVSSQGEMAVLLRPRSFVREIGIGTLARAPLAGGTPRELLENALYADWSADGSQLAVVRIEGSRCHLEFPLGKVLYETNGWVSHPRVSGDGRYVAFLDHPFRWDDKGSVMIVDSSGQSRTLSAGWVSVQGLNWAPRSEELWFTASKVGQGRGLYAVSLSGRQRLVYQQTGTLKLHDISLDGRVLLASDPLRTGMMVKGPGDTAERELSWHDLSRSTDLSNDGTTLLFTEYEDGPHYGTYLRRTDGSPPIRLGEGLSQQLSPDGKWALSIVRTPPAPLLLLPTGPGEAQRLQQHGINHVAAGWFPDGKRIVFAGSEPGRGERVYVQELAGGKPKPLTPEGVGLWSEPVSPDGKLIACVDSQQNLWLYPAEGSEGRRLPSMGEVSRPIGWSADSRALYVQGKRTPPARVYRFELATGRRTLWKEFQAPDPAGIVYLGSFVLSADARSYAYSYLHILSELYLVEGLR
ncbi:MAG: winged helix-turn-helix domain-containing protein [Acidobacteria bacterium]|nr:winged helix-turn-helix domain-containing protein [Acidobacteriota bacterium]